jgi:hypothetical protein
MKRASVFVILTLTLPWLGSSMGLPTTVVTANGSLPVLRARVDVALVAQLTPADGAELDRFGASLSVSGTTVLVGAPGTKVGNNLNQGTAYVFDHNQGRPHAWDQVAKLTASDGAEGNQLGESVALDGDTAVVGTTWATVGGNPSQGAAYVYYRDQGGVNGWGQVAKLVAADGGFADIFAHSVSISGDTIIVGAPCADSGGGYLGAAYVFERGQGGPDAWGQVAKLTAPDDPRFHFFGWSVSLDEDTAVVGAYCPEISCTWPGSALVFYRDQGGPGVWGQAAELTRTGDPADDMYGSPVAIEGDTAIIGAPMANVGGNMNQGAAYVFSRDEGGPDAWGQAALLLAVDGASFDVFGNAVSVSGEKVLVGNLDTDPAAYLFGRDVGATGAWGQIAKLTMPDAGSFGLSVSISGQTAVIGAPYRVGGSTTSGAAYVFALDIMRLYLPMVLRKD